MVTVVIFFSLKSFLIFGCHVIYDFQWVNNVLKDRLFISCTLLGVSGFILHNDDSLKWLSCIDRWCLCWWFLIFSVWGLLWSEDQTSAPSSRSDLDIISLQQVFVSFLLGILWSLTRLYTVWSYCCWFSSPADLHALLTAARCGYSPLVLLNARCLAQGHLSGCCSKRVTHTLLLQFRKNMY